MRTVIITIHLMIVVALVVIVLLQRSEGGALGIGGGGGFLTGRGQANALTRATAILGGLFFLTSIALTVESNLNRAPTSILSGGGAATPARGPAPAPAAAPNGDLLDQLRQMQNQRNAPAGGAAAPASPQPPPAAPAPAGSQPPRP